MTYLDIETTARTLAENDGRAWAALTFAERISYTDRVRAEIAKNPTAAITPIAFPDNVRSDTYTVDYGRTLTSPEGFYPTLPEPDGFHGLTVPNTDKPIDSEASDSHTGYIGYVNPA